MTDLRSRCRALHIEAANDTVGLLAYGWDDWEGKCGQRKLYLREISLVLPLSCARGIEVDVSFYETVPLYIYIVRGTLSAAPARPEKAEGLIKHSSARGTTIRG